MTIQGVWVLHIVMFLLVFPKNMVMSRSTTTWDGVDANVGPHRRLAPVNGTLSFLHSPCSLLGHGLLEPKILAFPLQVPARGYHWHPTYLAAVFCIEVLPVKEESGTCVHWLDPLLACAVRLNPCFVDIVLACPWFGSG